METLTVQVPRETVRRLEIMGFPYDVNGREILCFLIEQGLAVLEKHRSGNHRLAQRPRRRSEDVGAHNNEETA